MPGTEPTSLFCLKYPVEGIPECPVQALLCQAWGTSWSPVHSSAGCGVQGVVCTAHYAGCKEQGGVQKVRCMVQGVVASSPPRRPSPTLGSRSRTGWRARRGGAPGQGAPPPPSAPLTCTGCTSPPAPPTPSTVVTRAPCTLPRGTRHPSTATSSPPLGSRLSGFS